MMSTSIFVRVARGAAPAALVLLTAGLVAACPNCKEGLAQNDPQGQAIAVGFYYSILFMMAMPFAILASFGGLAYLSVRRAQQASAASTVEHPASKDAPAETEPATHA